MTDLMIAGVTIIQDEHGRYNLNALHQASELAGEYSKSPGQWLKRKTTQALIEALQTRVSYSTHEVVHGGERSGTYAHEILAVEYAGWISPDFRILVNQAFIDSRTRPSQDALLSRYPELKAIAEMAVGLAQVREEQKHLAQLVAHSQRLAHTSAEVAHMALQGQQWLTLRQYVFLHDLSRQMPLTVQQDYARWLGGYCLEKGLPMYKAQTADRAWQDERTYYIGAIHDTLPGWLTRNQAGISLVPGPAATPKKDHV